MHFLILRRCIRENKEPALFHHVSQISCLRTIFEKITKHSTAKVLIPYTLVRSTQVVCVNLQNAVCVYLSVCASVSLYIFHFHTCYFYLAQSWNVIRVRYIIPADHNNFPLLICNKIEFQVSGIVLILTTNTFIWGVYKTIPRKQSQILIAI